MKVMCIGFKLAPTECTIEWLGDVPVHTIVIFKSYVCTKITGLKENIMLVDT